MNPFYIWFVFFFFVGYLVITDESVARLVILIIKLIEVEYEKVKWWILHNPANPIVKMLIYRKSMKMAKELMKEFEERK
jgi:hypothetical protein